MASSRSARRGRGPIIGFIPERPEGARTDYRLHPNHTRLVKAHGSKQTRALVGTTGFKRASLHATGNTMQMEPGAKLRPSLTGRIARAARRTAGWFRPRATRRPVVRK